MRGERPRALILGCGRVGTLAALELREAGWQVVGVRREAAQQEPFAIVAGDAAEPELHQALRRRWEGFDAVLLTANPGFRSGGDNRLLAAAACCRSFWSPARIALVSSTAVYADAGGRRVDESGALAVASRALALRGIEDELLRLRDAVVLRAGVLGGLERARRSPRLAAGAVQVHGSPARRLSWVHERDLARLLRLAACGELGSGVLNACAPTHPSLAAFYGRWARALQLAVSVIGDDSAQAERLVVSARPELRGYPWRLDWAEA